MEEESRAVEPERTKSPEMVIWRPALYEPGHEEHELVKGFWLMLVYRIESVRQLGAGGPLFATDTAAAFCSCLDPFTQVEGRRVAKKRLELPPAQLHFSSVCVVLRLKDLREEDQLFRAWANTVAARARSEWRGLGIPDRLRPEFHRIEAGEDPVEVLKP